MSSVVSSTWSRRSEKFGARPSKLFQAPATKKPEVFWLWGRLCACRPDQKEARLGQQMGMLA